MKWFNDFEKKYLIHVILWVLIFILPLITPDEGPMNSFLMFIFMCLLMLEMAAIVLHVIWYKKYKNKQPETKEGPTVDKKYSDALRPYFGDTTGLIEVEIPAPTGVMHEGKLLRRRYCYTEKLCFTNNYDSIKLKENVFFRRNEKNEYDADTVEVVKGDIVIGLMYKGACRDIMNRCFKDNRYTVSAWVSKLDPANKEIKIKIGFYEEVNPENSIVASLTKTSKKDEMSGEKRSENLIGLTEGDIVYLEEESDVEGALVTDKYANQLGELSTAVVEKIEENSNAKLKDLLAVVDSIDYSGTTYKVKIRIYY